MNCKTLEQNFAAFLEGALEEEQSSSCLQHLNDCPRCGDLKEFLETSDDLALSVGTSSSRSDLVRSILQKTSGPTCEPSQILLGDLADKKLDPIDKSLVQTHLAECSDCRSLESIFRALVTDLPTLAELEPDSNLVAQVLRSTIPASVRIRRWWSTVWPQVVSRPRFAIEAAYVGTLALVLVFSTSGANLEAMPSKALAAARTAPIAHLQAPIAMLEDRVHTAVQPVWGSTRTKVELSLDRFEQRSRALFSRLTTHGGTLWSSFASLLERPGEDASPGSGELPKEDRS